MEDSSVVALINAPHVPLITSSSPSGDFVYKDLKPMA